MFHPTQSTIQSYKPTEWQGNHEDLEHNDTIYNFTWHEHNMTCIFQSSPSNFLTSSIFQTIVYITYSAVFIIALMGNGLVCFVVHNSQGMKTVTNYFIVNLAVGDILMTLFCVPFSFVPVLVLRYWPFGAIMCHVVNYSQAVSVLVSAYTLLAISIDRYLAILQPLKPRLGKFAAKAVVFAVWSGALATASPIPIVSQLHKPSLWHIACDVDICVEKWTNTQYSERYTLALLTLQFGLPLTALVGTYSRIAYVVWGVRPPGEAQSDRDSRMLNSKRKMIKMMVAVVVVFITCWLPLNIFIMLWTVYENDVEWSSWAGMPYVWFACHWLAMSHSCYNPIIYGYMNEKYRQGFKQAFSSLMCIKIKSSNRSANRSSHCDGIPMSEIVGVNGTQSRRRTIGNKCRISRAFSDPEGKWSRHTSVRKERNIRSCTPAVTRAPQTPARAPSVRTDLHYSCL